MKFRIMTSVDGVEPRNSAAKINANIIMYIMAIEAIMTIYENTLSHIEDKLRLRNLRIE